MIGILTSCILCGQNISAYRQKRKSKFCSNHCRILLRNEKYKKSRNHDLKISTASRGCHSELFAALDLLKQGFEVFRAINSHCSCDLAILKAGRLLRIEVRTGYVNSYGTIYYPKAARDEGRQDHFAIVYETPTGTKVSYFPELT